MIHSIIGFFSGIVSGMGIGGGAILIPALIFITGLGQQQAQGVNLLSYIPVASVAVYTHLKHKNIDKQIWLPTVATGVVGAVFGSMLANKLSPNLLRRIFGIFLFVIGLYQLFYNKKK